VGPDVTASLPGDYDPAARSYVLQAVKLPAGGMLEIEFHLQES